MPKHAPRPVLRTVLTRDLIVHTAVALIEREGVRALSMRAVAAELGVSAMAMYNHVPSKEELVRGIAEYVMETLELPEPTGDWRADARGLIRAFRRTTDEYPRSIALVVGNKTGIPVGLRAIERALAICDAAGIDGPTSVRVVRAMMAYTLGSQLRDAGPGPVADGPVDCPADCPAPLAPEADRDADFEFGLELFLSAVEAAAR
ncbi:TetR/AcrR family transcriptional regulator [Spirillospora albida]|uniref:TetR/AcrR family transcriptional regulator n=1 Tax=Spirillospora albida TaxID=58123 RepID=UPI0004C0248E|nr:TetR family transcriptional regulator [Spirillospora albida]